jgi:(2Fe-2S) ferredoxin
MNNKLKCHVFICSNCTYIEDGIETTPDTSLRQATKDEAEKLWDKSVVRINKSGCLGKCKKGIACVIYPQEEWLTGLKKSSSANIIDKIKQLLK